MSTVRGSGGADVARDARVVARVAVLAGATGGVWALLAADGQQGTGLIFVLSFLVFGAVVPLLVLRRVLRRGRLVRLTGSRLLWLVIFALAQLSAFSPRPEVWAATMGVGALALAVRAGAQARSGASVTTGAAARRRQA